MKTVTAKISDLTECSSFIKAHNTLCGIFNNNKVVSFGDIAYGVHLTGNATVMNRNNSLCFSVIASSIRFSSIFIVSGLISTNTIVAPLNTKAFAVGDCCISFFDVSNRTAITRKDVAVEGEIQRIFYNNEYLGLVVRDEAKTGYQLHIYTSEGNENAVTEQDELHTGYAFQQRNVVMYDADYCEVQSFSGRIRFAREFGNNLYTVIPGDKFKTYYLATMEELQQIKLR